MTFTSQSKKECFNIKDECRDNYSSLSFIYTFLLISAFLSYDFFYGENYEFIFVFSFPLILALPAALLSPRFAFFREEEIVVFLSAFALYLVFVASYLSGFKGEGLLLLAPIVILMLLKIAGIQNIRRVLIFILSVVVSLALIEHFVDGYLYEKTINNNGKEIVFGKDFFSGSTDLLRAKSIFIGPLTFSAFLISCAIVLRDNKVGLALCFFGALLSTSRTAIIVTFLIFFCTQIRFGKGKTRTTLLVFAFSFLSIFLLSFYYSEYLPRLVSVFNFSEVGANSYRLGFWISGLKEFSDYGFFDLLFGNPGYFRGKYGNGAESGWITLLLDFGFFGFLFYLVPLLYPLIKKRGFGEKACILSVFLANLVFTFCYGFLGCFFYWLTVYFINISQKKTSV